MHSAEPEYEPTLAEATQNEPWRSEVASRVSRYRAKRRRKIEGDQSMRLDFETEAQSTQQPPPARRTEAADTDFYRRANAAYEQPAAVDIPLAHATAGPASPVDAESEWLYSGPPAQSTAAASDYDPDFDFDTPRAAVEPEASEAARTDSNVIFFPKPLMATMPRQTADELADPVMNRPRILDVPEEVMPTIQGALFAEIHLDPEEESEPLQQAKSEFEIPLRVAMIPVRAYAGLMDWLLVLAASAVFELIVWTMIPALPHTKPMAIAAAIVPCFFWCVYQYLLLVYCGRTVGMQMAGITLRTFEGRHPNWAQRKTRALALVLSGASMGLGFVWAYVDPDMLCWHDRISRTYVAPVS